MPENAPLAIAAIKPQRWIDDALPIDLQKFFLEESSRHHAHGQEAIDNALVLAIHRLAKSTGIADDGIRDRCDVDFGHANQVHGKSHITKTIGEFSEVSIAPFEFGSQ